MMCFNDDVKSIKNVDDLIEEISVQDNILFKNMQILLSRYKHLLISKEDIERIKNALYHVNSNYFLDENGELIKSGFSQRLSSLAVRRN